jgi:polysaccharide export outer membrane protein
MRKYYDSLPVIFFLFCLPCFIFSCVSPKSITYFNNLPVAERTALDSLKLPEPVILINDILEIRVGGENEKTVQYINQYFGMGNTSASGGASGLQFAVDINGYIELPIIGKLKMAGLTRDQARDTLTETYKQYLQNPVVSVRFGTFHFSVLGEVKTPGNFVSTNEKVTIFEALAQAGDITSYGRFENVSIIRDINGNRSVIQVNLNDKKILNSEYYYINRYDLIYVQSRALKSVTENFARSASFIATITSVFAIILVVFKK